MDKSFERKYSINVARLKIGQHKDSFEIDHTFFDHFEQSLLVEGSLNVVLKMVKYGTHLDVIFNFEGSLMIPCDRCSELYPHFIKNSHRIIYAFDKEMNFSGYEVMYVDSRESHLSIVQELYDFINLAIPLKKVPSQNIHKCAPEVLEVLGIDSEGNPLPPSEDETQIDPRWEKLRKLKDKLD